MHFAALIALAVVASSVLVSAAPTTTSYSGPQATSTRDDGYIIAYRLSDRALDSATTKRDDDSIIQNKRSQPLPAGVVLGTGSGIVYRSPGIKAGGNLNKPEDEVTEGASSGNTKRQAPESDEIYTGVIS
ncbi:hypothetical protein P692DRAFT_20879957 [Suillus brevipes Sb2]|nr:hypothetical protein P692DRAFT_20879957 [Suillus brevipes Sb2]